MNEDIIKGNWKQFKGKIKEQWGKLQERHGIAKEEAEKQLNDWQGRHPDYRFED